MAEKRLRRFSPTRIRPGEAAELNSSRNFDSLVPLLNGYAEEIETRAAGLDALVSKVGKIIPPAILGAGKIYDVRAFGTLAKAITYIGSDFATLYITNEQAVTANTTIPSNISIVVLKGGSFAISTGVTLTINGSFSAGPYSVITGSGILVLARNSAAAVYSEWYGAGGAGATDDGAAFGKAVDLAVASTIPLAAPGSYTLTTWTQKEIAGKLTILGDGMERSIITGPNTSTNFLYIRNGLEVSGVTFQTWQKIIRGAPASGATSPVDKISFDRVQLKSAVHGIYLQGSSGESINSGVRDLLVTRCVFNGITAYGMEVFYKRFDNCIIDGNRFVDFAGSGSVVGVMFGYDLINEGDTGSPGHAKRRSVKVINNHFEELNSSGANENQAIIIHEADEAIVSNNTIKGLSNTHAGSEDCEAIYIRSVKRAIVQSNTLTKVKAGEALIDVKEFCEYAEIIDNVIDNEDYEDLDGSTGILCFCHGTMIARNTIRNTGGFGINLVDYLSTADAHIIDNIIENVGAFAGIFAYCSEWSTISRNFIRTVNRNYATNPNYGALADTNLCGIYILSPASTKKYWNVCNNTIHVDGTYAVANTSGIRIITGIEESVLSGNTISGVRTAIHADYLEGCVVVGNRGTATVAWLVADTGTIGNHLDSPDPTFTGTLAVLGATTLTGPVGIGAAPGTQASLQVGNTGNTGTTQYGILNNILFGTGATNTGISNYIQFAASGSFTMGAGRALYIDSPSISAATITEVIGLEIANQTGGGTNRAMKIGTGLVSFADTTDATSASTGAIVSLGGLGLAKALWVGGLVNINGAVTLQNLAGTGNRLTQSDANGLQSASIPIPAGGGVSTYVARGSVTLVAGVGAVANASVTTNAIIRYWVFTPGGTQGFLSYANNAGVGFAINSTNAADTSVIQYEIASY